MQEGGARTKRTKQHSVGEIVRVFKRQCKRVGARTKRTKQKLFVSLRESARGWGSDEEN